MLSLQSEPGGTGNHRSACRRGAGVACDSFMYPVLMCLIVMDNAQLYVPKLSRSHGGFAYTLQLSQILYCWQ